MIDFILSLLILACVAFAVRHVVIHKKKCKCGNCAGCMKAQWCKDYNKENKDGVL